ncbi:hypothetical protein XFF6992_190095 [Xanthomonas citri pv. fuscans]|nr:hypothetical protein XFF6992_190095 [Xanthomonas citri pv. fuscans]
MRGAVPGRRVKIGYGVVPLQEMVMYLVSVVSALRSILPTCTERFDPNGRCCVKKSRRCLAGGFSSLEILRF